MVEYDNREYDIRGILGQSLQETHDNQTGTALSSLTFVKLNLASYEFMLQSPFSAENERSNSGTLLRCTFNLNFTQERRHAVGTTDTKLALRFGHHCSPFAALTTPVMVT